jgi:hypothetical protein
MFTVQGYRIAAPGHTKTSVLLLLLVTTRFAFLFNRNCAGLFAKRDNFLALIISFPPSKRRVADNSEQPGARIFASEFGIAYPCPDIGLLNYIFCIHVSPQNPAAASK